jgi:peptide/nickel transport system permease protein
VAGLMRPGLLLYVGRRLVTSAVLLLLLTFITFSLLKMAPGSPERLLLGTRPATPANLASIRQEFHLNETFWAQYLQWLTGVLHLQFGQSIATLAPISQMLGQAVGVSVELALLGAVVAVIGGLLLGVLASVYQESPFDRSLVVLSIFGVSSPAFVTGIVLILIFSVELNWLPAYGTGAGGMDTVRHLALPGLALGLSAMALVVKITRTTMVRELASDYVTFARARGASRMRATVVYALRNALIPIVTSAGLVFSYLIVGAVLIEVVFTLPGLGTMLVTGVTSHDIPVVQAVTLTIGIVVIGINLVTDITYLLLDPRVQPGRTAS